MGFIFTFLFRTKIGHFVLAILFGMTIIGALRIGLWFHDNQVRNDALMHFNQNQIDLIQRQNERLKLQMQKIEETANRLTQQMQESNDKIDTMTGDIKNSLDNLNVQGKDDKISPYMEETIKQLERMERHK